MTRAFKSERHHALNRIYSQCEPVKTPEPVYLNRSDFGMAVFIVLTLAGFAICGPACLHLIARWLA